MVQKEIYGGWNPEPPHTPSSRMFFSSFFVANHMGKVVSTHLWNTPLNLYQKAKEGFFHNWLTGDCLGCAISGCVETTFEHVKRYPSPCGEATNSFGFA